MSVIKLLHTADLHLDSAFEALSPIGADERRKGQRELLFKLSETAEARGVHALLLCGDIFDGTAGRDTVFDFCRAMGALSCPVIVAPGNHDPYGSRSVWKTAVLPENVYIFKNASIECVEFPGLEARFWGAAFQNAFSPPLFDGFIPPSKQNGIPDIMLIHGDVGAGKSDYNPITGEDLSKCGMDYVALGHIHGRTPLKTVGKTAYAYPGCPEGRGFDETGEKGALLVTISETGVSAEFIPLGGVRYEIIKVDIGGKNPLEAARCALSGLSSNDCCRLVLTGECEEPTDASFLRKQLEASLRELQIRDETALKQDVWVHAGQDTLSGVFLEKLRRLYDTAKTAEERKKIELAARYGLAAIENGGGLI